MTFATRNIGAARAGLAILIVFINGAIMAAMLAVQVPEANKDILLLLVGSFANATGIVCGHYFTAARKAGANG